MSRIGRTRTNQGYTSESIASGVRITIDPGILDGVLTKETGFVSAWNRETGETSEIDVVSINSDGTFDVQNNGESAVIAWRAFTNWNPNQRNIVGYGERGVNPSTRPPVVEEQSDPDDDLMLLYPFGEESEPVLNASPFAGAEVTPGDKMWRGTFSGTVTLSDSGGPGDNPYCTIDPLSAIQIQDSQNHIGLDNYFWDWVFDVRCTDKCRPMRRTPASDVNGTGAKTIAILDDGRLLFSSWGNGDYYWTPDVPLNNGKWREDVCVRYRRLPQSNHGLISARVDGVWLPAYYINNGLNPSVTSHYTWIGSIVNDGQDYGGFDVANVRYYQRSVRP